ncbi:MAG: methyltransferase domain-containing protein [Brevinema sp.]
MITKRNSSVLFIVQSGKKYGIGHLKRALTISEYYEEPFIWVLTDLKDTSSLSSLLNNIPHEISQMNDHPEQKNIFIHKHFDMIVVDCDQLNSKFIAVLNKLEIPVIALDNAEVGRCAEVFVAPLPSRKVKTANFKQLYQTPINEEYFQISEQKQPRNILISLGGSDPHKNTDRIVKALKDQHYMITVIQGPLATYSFDEYSNVKVISNVDSLVPYIQQNDIIICGPGSTLVEAMAAQKKVIAVPHTWSQAMDLQTIQGLKIIRGVFTTSKQIRNAIENAQILKLPKPDDFQFADWWLSISDNITNRAAFCPLCGSHNKKAMLRTDRDNRFRCNTCDSGYVYNLTRMTEPVDADTIIGSNMEQAQQTYKVAVLEQKEDSNRRIKIIKQILPTPTSHSFFYKLLDIGANHGIFVQEASHNGFNAQGVELASFARRIAVDNNIQIFDSMETLYNTKPIYHIITIWDKLELLPDPLSYIEKITKMLAPGGLLAIRIPIEESPSFMKGFFRTSLKSGELLAKRAGLMMVHSAKYTNKRDYLEFYCIKKGNA